MPMPESVITEEHKEPAPEGSSRLFRDHPRLTTAFDGGPDTAHALLHSASVRNALKRLFPNNPLFHEENEDHQKETFTAFQTQLPFVKCLVWKGNELRLSVFFYALIKGTLLSFFYDMISRWLLPGKRLHVTFSFSTSFKLIDFSDEPYTFSEMVISLEDEGDLESIVRTFPVLEAEIRLGSISPYHASRILEIKGLSADEKTSYIQEKIALLVQKKPKDFDYDIFNQMQHFLVMCKEEFKSVRETQQMARIICVFYIFRKILRKQVEEFPHKRHLMLKLLKTHLQLPFGIKQVLSLFVGVSFLKENEIFEEKHLLRAVRNFLPNVEAVPDSCFVTESREDRIHIIYLEIVKEDGSNFSLQEMKLLRQGLTEDLKSSVEQLMRPIFMPRNEEEVMRNIVTLSHQLRYLRDIPQVITSFNEQADADLLFTVVLLRILQTDSPPVQELFHSSKTQYSFILERNKKVGLIRKKYPKEASVFRVRLPASPFSRNDHSVDLYKARNEVVSEVQRILGEVRDYNGGMIAKQNELLLALKVSLGEIGSHHEFLLENFFHSLFPIEIRSVTDCELLKKLFLFLLELMSEQDNNKPLNIRVKEEGDRLFLIAAVQEGSLRENMFDVMEKFHVAPAQLITLDLQTVDATYLGYIYTTEDKSNKELFIREIQSMKVSQILARIL